MTLMLLLAVSSCATFRSSRDFTEELELSGGPGVVINDVPSLSKDRANGGVSAVEALIAFWKKPMLPAEAENRLVAGTSALLIPQEEVMTDLADRRYLWSFSFYATMTELESRLNAGIPALVMVQDDAGDTSTRRYMLVVGYNQIAGKLLVHEEKAKTRTYTYAEFRRIWKPVRNWTFILCPPEQITWNISSRERAARARFYERVGQWSEALSDLDVLLQNDPDNVNIMLKKGHIKQLNRDLPGAEQEYRNVLSIDPLNARAANNLAYLLAEQTGDLKEAERWVRRALTIEPSNPAFLHTLGLVLMRQQRPAEAAKVLERALHRSENLPGNSRHEITADLIRAFIDSNQKHLAVQVLNEARKQDAAFSIPAEWQYELDGSGVNR